MNNLSLILMLSALSACSLMPGMQNLDTSKIQRLQVLPQMQPRPTLILITPGYLTNKRQHYTYHVAPADILNITVWEHPEFNLENGKTSMSLMANTQGGAGQSGYLVNPNGRIFFPLVGEIKVSGYSIDQIRMDLTKRLKKYIPNPQLHVRVADFRGQKIYVIGEVKKPGIIPLNDQALTIADALALVGGIEQNYADPKHIYVIRGNILTPKIYWLDAKTPDKLLLAEHFDLDPKDILYVSSAPATSWNRILKQLLPTIEAVWYTKAITR